MSAPVYLLNYSKGAPVSIDAIGEDREGAALAEANYQIPVLWLALFTEANVTPVLIDYDRDANGRWLKRPEPTLFTTRQAGLATYARRKVALRNKLGSARARYIDDWERLLASPIVRGTDFQIELSEVMFLYAEGEFGPVLSNWLKGIETLSGPGWEDLCNQANLNDPHSRVVNLGMRGWTHHDELGWGD